MAPADGPVYRHGGQIVKEHGSEEALADATAKSAQRVLQTVDRRINDIEACANTVRAQINNAIDHSGRQSPSGIAEGTEVRAYVRGLPETQRFTFIKQAVDSGDLRTVAAVLHSPAYLSGLSREHHDLMRGLAEAKFAPTERNLLTGMTKAVNHLRQGADVLNRRTSEITSVAATRAAKRAAALGRLGK